MRVAMSASRKPTAWCWPIGLPNAFRVLAYSTEYSKAARAMPIAEAARWMRDSSKVCMRL